MKYIRLNAHLMTNEPDASEYLYNQFKFPPLPNRKADIDDFLDNLLEIDEDITINVDDTMMLVDNLGRFGLGVIKALHKADEENEYINLELL